MEELQIYKDMPWLKDLLQVASPWLDFLRSFAYWILTVLAHGVDLCSNAVNGVLGIDITKISPVQKFVTNMSPVTWSILTIAIAAGAIYMMISGGKNKVIFKNIIFAGLLIVAIPFMFTQLNAFKDAGVKDMKSYISGNSSAGEQILRSYVVDVQNSTKGKATLASGTNPFYLDINARLPKEDPWLYKITSVSGNKIYGEELGSGFFGWGDERLYAYNFDFFMPFITMIVTMVAMIFAGFKISRTIFDLLYHQVIAGPVFASDINSGARTKKFLNSLIGSFIMLVLVLVVIKIFLDVNAWVNLNVQDAFVRLLMIAGSAWGVIDGPDIIVKLLGVDAGVRSASSVLLGANAAISAAGTAAQLSMGALNKGGALAGGLAAVPGIMDKYRKGIAAAESGDFGGISEYGKSLSKNAEGLKGFAAGNAGISNLASRMGFRDSKMSSLLSGGIKQGQLKDQPSPLSDANIATGGKPSESAESAAAKSTDIPADNYASTPTEKATDSTVNPMDKHLPDPPAAEMPSGNIQPTPDKDISVPIEPADINGSIPEQPVEPLDEKPLSNTQDFESSDISDANGSYDTPAPEISSDNPPQEEYTPYSLDNQTGSEPLQSNDDQFPCTSYLKNKYDKVEPSKWPSVRWPTSQHDDEKGDK